MPTTVQKWGNSLGIRIPPSIAERVNLHIGTEVEFDTAGGVLTVRPRRRRKYTLAGLLAKAKGRSPPPSLGQGPSARPGNPVTEDATNADGTTREVSKHLSYSRSRACLG